MMISRSRIPTVLALMIGVFMGWGLSSFRPVPLQAERGRPFGRVNRGDRTGARSLRRGSQRARRARCVYFLDYKGGRLLATVPSYRQTTTSTRLHRAIQRTRSGG